MPVTSCNCVTIDAAGNYSATQGGLSLHTYGDAWGSYPEAWYIKDVERHLALEKWRVCYNYLEKYPLCCFLGVWDHTKGH